MTKTNVEILPIIRGVILGTLNDGSPSDTPFTEAEVKHIAYLLSDPKMKMEVWIKRFVQEGGDGELYQYAGIRRKDGRIPADKKIQRIYKKGYIELGFLLPPAQANKTLLAAFRDAGFGVDALVLARIA